MLTALVADIRKMAEQLPERPRLMEVCGTHTVAMFRHGIRDLLGDSVELVSGPGCPVCVTPDPVIDRAIAYARQGHIIASFGDMLRVPGTESSLLEARAEGADVRVVTSPMVVADWAGENPGRAVVFLGVGFETTVPGSCLLVEDAKSRGLENLFVLSAHKIIPPAFDALLSGSEQKISGFICPGHVSAIIGLAPYQRVAGEYHMPCVVAGFEPGEILLSIAMLLRQLTEGAAKAEIQYTQVVRPEGNLRALALINRIFHPADTAWRGLGEIPGSGLTFNESYARFDAELHLAAELPTQRTVSGCLCGHVLRGVISPFECPQFDTECRPDSPLGPCMVSSEGSCAVYYMFKERR